MEEEMHMPNRRGILGRRGLAIVAAILAVILSSCANDQNAETAGADEDTAIAGTSMAYTNATDGAPLFVLLQDGTKKAAKVAGVSLETYDNKGDAATVSENARLISQTKPDYVLSFNPVEGIYRSIERLYEQADIPCIAVNTPASGYCHWLNLSNPELCTDSAKAVAKAAKEEDWSGNDVTVLLLNAPAYGEQLNNCNAYFYKELANQMPGIEPISDVSDLTTTTSRIGDSMVQVDGEAVRGASYNSARAALSSIPDNRKLVVWSINDDSTMGAWQAVEQAGRAKQSLVAGLGGTEGALKQLETNPRWIAEADIFFGHWGQYMMAMAAAIKDGADLPFQTLAPEAVLTKDSAIEGTIVAPMSDYYREGEYEAYRLPPLVAVDEGETVFGTKTIGNEYLADTGVLQLFKNVEGLKP